VEATELDCIDVLWACERAGEKEEVPLVSPRLEDVGGGEAALSAGSASVVTMGDGAEAVLVVVFDIA